MTTFGDFLLGQEPFATSDGSGSGLHQLLVIIGFLGAFVGCGGLSRPLRLFAMPLSLLITLAWCWASVIWSIAPEVSIRRLVLASVTVTTAFMLARELGYDRMVAMLRYFVTAALIACFLRMIISPSTGIQLANVGMDEGSAGSWRGIMMDKNTCGSFCAVTALLFIFNGRSLNTVFRVGMIIAAVFFLVKTQSKTSMGVLALATVAGLCFYKYNPTYRLLLIPAMMCVAVAVWIMGGRMLMPFYAALYDPTAFTGRGLIWIALVHSIRDHWLLGSGFGAFWGTGASSPIKQYSTYEWIRDGVSVGHNGYLDIWVQIGLVGLVLLVLSFIVIPTAKLFYRHFEERGAPSLLIALLVFSVGNNFTETTFLNRDLFLNVIMLLIIALTDLAPRAGSQSTVVGGGEKRGPALPGKV
ncbi:O-antigen ligase family protein [Sphingomonas sp. ID0503]|uniref:O-antigen ligase family protein n=1 Tax=Sphingomonas sp. ID0503 TaxID=3399691 RepID=UPI003AFB6EB8